MPSNIATRATDERLLTMVRMRAAGVKTPQIARDMGTSKELVIKMTNHVMRADRAESGEIVDGGYW